LGEDVLRVDWSVSARLFIGAARNGALSKEPDVEADLATCVRLIRDWPPDIVFCLETQNPVMGKVVLGREDVALLPEPVAAP
jgi:hypothetical protein